MSNKKIKNSHNSLIFDGKDIEVLLRKNRMQMCSVRNVGHAAVECMSCLLALQSTDGHNESILTHTSGSFIAVQWDQRAGNGKKGCN